MMKNLLYKEFRLALHPTTVMFWLLSAMLLIPSYPYYVVFFYTTLGLFFVCLGGRENHDIEYTMSLPVRKKDVVRARFAFVIIVETVQMLAGIPFAALRQGMGDPGNMAGMDANISLFGLSLIMLGIFNFVFFVRYYKNPDKVGRAFALASIAVGLYILIAEALTFIVPFVRDRLDTPDPQFLTEKLATLALGAAVYALLTFTAFKKSERSFEALDL